MNRSFNQITTKLIEIENVENLFDWKIDNIYIWEVIRYKIYGIIIEQSFKDSNPVKKNIFKKIKDLLTKFFIKIQKYINAIYFNPFFDRRRSDVLIFESSRKLIFNGSYIDPYTKFTYDDLIKEGYSITRYQSSYNYDKLSKRDFSIKHLDLPYLLSDIKTKLLGKKISETDAIRIKDLQNIIQGQFQINFDLKKLIFQEVNLFKYNLFFFKRLLKRKNPKKIIIANFCDKTALISAARSNKIKVIDIQHGLISSDDIIYHYPHVKEESLQYFPDQFYAWSPIWQKLCKLPLKQENIIDYGNKYLQNQKRKYSDLQKTPDQLIVISQPGLTAKIANEFIQKCNLLAKYQILYKLHPSEYLYAFENAQIKQIANMKNVSFVDKHDDLYKVLAETQYVVGVGSTVLIESISFECKVILFEIPGVEWMNPFIDDKNVMMFDKMFL